jgi:hypothetical protein
MEQARNADESRFLRLLLLTPASNKCYMQFIPCLLLLLLGSDSTPPANDLLQRGFDDMYNLSFPSAHHAFEDWEKLHPENPEGPAFEAAAYLFSEFDRLKILQSEFFLNNRGYAELKRETPSTEVKLKFEQALAASKRLSDKRLQRSSKDESALFANVLALGLHADYLALIQKRNVAALREIKQATQAAEDLLRMYPDCYDAYIAEGIENYLLSLKPAPVRWLLQASGAKTDKQTGIEKLRLTATKGQYLQPYAELLLAVAALRDNNNTEARRSLTDLSNRYPQNRLYREELSKIH